MNLKIIYLETDLLTVYYLIFFSFFLALQIIKEGRDQDDLNELAKLFDIHKS